MYPDSASYITAMYYFEGRAISGAAYFRLLRPVVPFCASLLNHFVGIEASFSVLNFILWCSSSLLMFKLAELLTDRTDAAFISSAIFTASIPMLLYGGAILTDMADYFFVLLGTFLVLRLDLPRASYPKVVATSLIIALGVLSKEFVASVIITAMVWTLLTKGSWRRVALVAFIVFAVTFVWSTVIGVSYVSWFSYAVDVVSKVAPFESQNVPVMLRAWIWIRTIRLAFRPEILLAGIIGFVVILKHKIKLPDFVASLSGPTIITAALALAGAGTDYRYTFIMFPGLLPLAALGILCVTREVATMFAGRGGRSEKLATLLSLLIVLAFIVETNLITLRYLSLPWHPYIAPQ